MITYRPQTPKSRILFPDSNEATSFVVVYRMADDSPANTTIWTHSVLLNLATNYCILQWVAVTRMNDAVAKGEEIPWVKREALTPTWLSWTKDTIPKMGQKVAFWRQGSAWWSSEQIVADNPEMLIHFMNSANVISWTPLPDSGLKP